MLKVHIINPNPSYVAMFTKHNWEITAFIEKANLVQFTGGEDLNPKLYSQDPHSTTYYNDYRDNREIKLYNKCRKLKIPMTGICRGGQFLHVAAGGFMIQHCNNHLGEHEATITTTGNKINVTSTHHQMMGDPTVGRLLLHTKRATSKFGTFKSTTFTYPKLIGLDIEAMFYHSIKALSFQPHPEFSHTKCTNLYFHFINKYLFNK